MGALWVELRAGAAADPRVVKPTLPPPPRAAKVDGRPIEEERKPPTPRQPAPSLPTEGLLALSQSLSTSARATSGRGRAAGTYGANARSPSERATVSAGISEWA